MSRDNSPHHAGSAGRGGARTGSAHKTPLQRTPAAAAAASAAAESAAAAAQAKAARRLRKAQEKQAAAAAAAEEAAAAAADDGAGSPRDRAARTAAAQAEEDAARRAEQSEEGPSDPEEESDDEASPANLLALIGQLRAEQRRAAQQRKSDVAALLALQQQLALHAATAARVGTVLPIATLAPASRSTLKTEPGLAAQAQAAATAAPDATARRVAQEQAEEARSPTAPGVEAALRAAPPRMALPEVKPELEATKLARDPALLAAWLFQMERHLRVLEQSSTTPYTFGDRLNVATNFWDAGMQAWWITTCEARAAQSLPAIVSWEGLVSALREAYSPVADALEASRQIQYIKQAAAETMEAYVRRALDLQARLAPAQWPSHVIAEAILNGVDSSRFPQAYNTVRTEATVIANAHAGRGPEAPFVATRLRSLAQSEPAHARGGASSSEIAGLRAEMAKMQRQFSQNASAHTAALYTASPDDSSNSGFNGSGNFATRGRGGRGGFRGGFRGGSSRGGRGGSRGGRGGAKRTPLDGSELDRRYAEGLCFDCGEPGHIGRDCPTRSGGGDGQEGAGGAPKSKN